MDNAPVSHSREFRNQVSLASKVRWMLRTEVHCTNGKVQTTFDNRDVLLHSRSYFT